MRLLIVGINYSPEETGIGPYTAGLAEGLTNRGHSVVAVTGLPSYPRWRVHDGYRRELWRREWIDGVDVRRRWHYVPSTQSAVQRGLYEGTFLLTGLSALALPRPDLLLGVIPSLSGGLLVRLAALRFGVPYGLIFQDLMGQAAEQSGVSGGGRVSRAVRAAEGWAARGAAAIGIIAEGFRPYIESLGVRPARILRVRNWTHIETAALGCSTVRARFGLPQDAFICLHAGNMGHKQSLENVLECARSANGSCPRLLFVLMGDGNQRSHLEDLAKRRAIPNLRFLPIQPPDVFQDILAAADILLVNQRGTVGDMALPSKLTSYFAAGRPIIAAVRRASEAAREIEASGGGLVVPPDQPKVLLEAIQRLSNEEEWRRQMGESARAWSLAMLSEAAALDGYERLLAAALARSKRSTTAARVPEEAEA